MSVQPMLSPPARRSGERSSESTPPQTRTPAGPGTRLARVLATALADPSATPASPSGPEWSRVGRLGLVRVEEPSAAVRGARLRSAPDPGAPVIWHMPENTRVLVTAENAATSWLHVSAATTGQRGYVASWLIVRPLPDPEARLYYVSTAGLGMQRLVETEYSGYDIRTGDDARTLVTAVLLANEQDPRTRGRVYINREKLRAAQDVSLWESFKDRLDEYRRVMRPILQSVEVQHGTDIWLPGPTYVRALQDKGIIPTRPEWKNAAIAAGKGITGFVAGLADGIISSVVDVFVGIWDLVKSVISGVRMLISGDALSKAEELYDVLVTMSPAELLGALRAAVVQVLGPVFRDFVRRWTQDNVYEKWYFRGQVVGYVLAEVLMAVFTGGSVTAVKWLSKLGKVGGKLAAVLGKVLGRVDHVLDAVPGRRRRTDRHRDVDPDDPPEKQRQLAAALTMASVIAEQHDAVDSPIPLLGAALNALRARFRWIRRFEARRTGQGQYEIAMIGSRYVIDPLYTTGHLWDSGDDIGEALPEGTHNVHTTTKPRTRSLTDAEVLADNLRRTVGPRPPGHEAHHIVPKGMKEADEAREILRKADIDINAPENGIWLPKDPSVPNVATTEVHSAVHTRRAVRILTAELREGAQDGPDGVRRALAEVRRRLAERRYER